MNIISSIILSIILLSMFFYIEKFKKNCNCLKNKKYNDLKKQVIIFVTLTFIFIVLRIINKFNFFNNYIVLNLLDLICIVLIYNFIYYFKDIKKNCDNQDCIKDIIYFYYLLYPLLFISIIIIILRYEINFLKDKNEELRKKQIELETKELLNKVNRQINPKKYKAKKK